MDKMDPGGGTKGCLIPMSTLYPSPPRMRKRESAVRVTFLAPRVVFLSYC